ncbi:MAG: hypothetical protein ACHQXA_00175 [Gemmatimonadales bacterium]
MSRPVALTLLACSALALPLAAQHPARDSQMTALAARADTLLHRWREAEALAGLADSVAHRAVAGQTDTIRVGGLRIITNPSPLRLREAAAAVWAMADSLYGTFAGRFAAHPYFIQAVDPDTTAPRPDHPWGAVTPWGTDTATLIRQLLAALPLPPVDTALHNWLRGDVRPDFDAPSDRAHTYLRLVTAPYQVNHRCFAGDIRACRSALNLDAAAAIPTLAFSTAEERQRVALALFASLGDDDQPEYLACTKGSDSACTAMLRSVATGFLPRPLDNDGRQLLVHLALSFGGREAYIRLLADPEAPIPDRLAYAAGIPLDQLIGRWQAEVLAARPQPVKLPPLHLLAGFGWVVLFGLSGLGSSRWRVS